MFLPLRNISRFFKKSISQPGYALDVAMKRFKAYSAYKKKTGIAPDPEAITLFLTHRCNLKCKMCGQWGDNGASKFLTRDVVLTEQKFSIYNQLIADVAPFKPSITLFGGEPTLHPACITMIHEIKRNNMHCVLITNGSTLNQYAQDIVNYGLDELNVSIDGLQPIHDEIRGMPGLFKNIVEGLKKIKHLKESANKKTPIVNIQCTINPLNYKHLIDIGTLAQDCGASSITYHNLIFLSRELYQKQQRFDEKIYTKSPAWEGFIDRPDISAEEIYNQISAAKKKYPSINIDMFPNFSLKELNEYYANPLYYPKEYPARCISPWLTAYVFPDGTVRPCLNSQYSFGNLNMARFPKIWNSKEAVNFRRILTRNKVFPACIRCTEMYRY